MKNLFTLFALLIVSHLTSGQSFNEIQKLSSSDRKTRNLLGHSVSISGDYLIVGAPQDNTGNIGQAFVYEKNVNGSWTEKNRLISPDAVGSNAFGLSVAISGSYAVVGAIGVSTDENASNPISGAGAAYIYERDGSGNWNQVKKIVASDRGTGDFFGYSVSISGDYILIGSQREDEDADGNNTIADAGSVYVFERDGSGNWAETQKIVASDRADSDYFGSSLAVSGSYAIVGSYNNDLDASGGNFVNTAGGAYIFERDGSGNWNQVEKIVASDRALGDSFGRSVAISGTTIIVGADREDHDENGTIPLASSGSAYIFERSGGSWSQTQKIVSSDRGTNDFFGYSVSILNDQALIGAYLDDQDINGANDLASAGSAYLFEKQSGVWTQLQKFDASDRGADDRFGTSVALSNSNLIIGADKEDEDENGNNTLSNAGSAYVFELNVAPTDIVLSPSSIAENLSDESEIGTLSSTDPNPDTHSYSLVSGTGDTDNDFFQIDSDRLKAKITYDFETKSTYSLRVQTTDQYGLSFAKALTVTITDANDVPDDILLSSTSINENAGTNALVGTFSTSDQDTGDTHSYNLISGTGDDHNDDFSIVNGNELILKASADFEAQSSYNIRVQTLDGSPKSGFNKSFVITINNLVDDSNNDILSFKVPGQIGTEVIDINNHTVTLDAGHGNDITNLTPAITVSTSATISPLTGLSQDFSNPVNYTVTAEDGSQQVWVVNVDTKIQGGTYVIGSAADYNSLNTAFADLKTFGLSGDIIFEIQDGYTDHTSTHIWNRFEGTIEHAITIRPEAGATSGVISGHSSAAAIQINGLENLTIDGQGILTLRNSGTGRVAETWIDWLGDNSPPKNITVRSCQFESISGAVSMGAGDGFIFENNVFEGRVSASTHPTQAFGVISHVANTTIRNNTIIYNNYNRATGTLWGIDIRGLDSEVYNNIIILNPIEAAVINGISVSAETGLVAHNTIHVGGSSGTITPIINGVQGTVSATSAIAIKNNIFSLFRDLDSQNKSGILTNRTTQFVIQNNNIDFGGSPGSNSFVKYGSTSYTTLSSVGAVADNTTSETVSYVDLTNHDLNLTGANLNSAAFRGVGLAEVSTDFDGTSRHATVPSIGAYEYANTVADITGFSFTNQVGSSTINHDNHTITAEISAGSSLNSVTPTITTFVGSGINPNSGVAQDFTSEVTYTVTAEAGNTQQWSVSIAEQNAPPTEVQLDNVSIAENEVSGTVVGTLSSADVNVGDSHTYSLVAGTGDDDNASFTIDADQLKSNAVFDFETKNSFSILVRSADGNGGTFDQQLTISITNIFEAPTDLALDNSSLQENNDVNAVIGNLATTDEDAGETYTYSIVAGTGDTDNGSFNINGVELRASSRFDFETKSSYSVRVQTNDGNGGTFAKELSIGITNASESPTDLSLDHSSIQENNAINDVIGVLSTTDEDAGETYTYTLVAGSGDTDNGSFNINGNELRASESFDFETQNSYTVRIQTDDGNGRLFAKAVAISVTNQNESPTDILLSSTNIDESAPIGTSVGTLSTTDGDNGETYTYTLVTGTGDVDNASFSIVGNELQSAEIFDFETKTSYSVRIQTNDGNGGTFQKAFTISINDQPPGLTGIGITSASLNENTPAMTAVGDLFALGDEIAGISFTFTLVSGTGDTGNSSFEIVGEQLRSTASFDFEGQNQYSIRINANDGSGATIDQVLLIDIKNVNEVPTDIQISGASIGENNSPGYLVGNFTTTDEDSGDSHSYALVSGTGSDDNGSFQIVGNQLQAATTFDFESKSSFTARVQTNDGNGGTFEEVFSISISDQNDPPTALVIDGSSIDENNAISALVGSLSTTDQDVGDSFTYDLISGAGDTDNGSFSISGNQLLAGASFDFESQSSYSIRVQTNDGNGGLFEASFTISINDVNENPTDISLSDTSLEESNPVGSLIGSLSSIDPDMGQTFTYTLVSGTGDDDNTAFTISGPDLLTAEIFDFETKSSYSIRVQTSDGNGGTFQEVFSISVIDLPASITSFTLGANSINENSASGSQVGLFSTTGEDLSGSFTYTLVAGSGDTDNASFSISGNQLLTATSLNFETQSSYSIRVMTDDGGISEEQVFTISVNDVFEAPTALLLSQNAIDENNSLDIEIGTFSTADEDLGETHSYSLVDGIGADDNASFVIVNDKLIAGVIFDFETQNSYTIRVETNDGNGGTLQEIFIISINDVFENTAPTVAMGLNNASAEEGFGSSQISYANVFADADADALNVTVASSDETVVTAEVIAGDLIQINEVGIGTSTITVTANDGNGGSVNDTFTFEVTEAPNNAPTVVNPIADASVEESFRSSQISYANVFEDVDGDALTVTVASSDETVVTAEIVAGDLIQINETGIGTSTITVTANDGNGGSINDTFTFEVTETPNNAPTVANPLADASAEEGFGSSQISYANVFEDVDGDALTVTVASSDESVVTAEIITGDLIQINEVGIGTSTITVTANDGKGGSVNDTFTLEVTEAPNNAPTVSNPLADASVEEGFGSSQISYANVFEDADGDALNVTVASSDETVVTAEIVTGDLIQINEVGIGTSTITVTANDGNGGSVSDVFAFEVTEAVNSAPTVANPLADASVEEGFGSSQINYADVFEDVDGDALTVTVASSDESVVTAEIITGDLIQINEVGIGTSTITVTANDGKGGSVNDTFTLEVTEAPNSAPTVSNPLADASAEEGFGSSQISYADVFEDVDGDALNVTVASSDETVVTAEIIAGDLIQLNEVGIGTSTITVTANDGNGGSVNDTFTFEVTEAPNSAPTVANPLADASAEEGFGSSQISYANVFEDVDGDALNVTVASSDEAVVTAEIVGDLIQINEVGIGTSIITVTADDGNGGSISDTFTFEVTEAPLGFEDEIEVSIYPNPVIDLLQVRSDESVSVILTTVDGREIKKVQGSNLSIDMSSLGSAVYILTVDNGGVTTRKRIVKAN